MKVLSLSAARGYCASFAFTLSIALTLIASLSQAQVNDDQLGGWYMYFWSLSQERAQDEAEGTFGLQGDIQHRNWNVIGDLEQLLLRGGLTYQPAHIGAKLTLGYAHITTGDFGESDQTSAESRIYQEALIPHRVASRLLFTHRYRFEQRLTDAPSLRTRFRYALFMNVPLNRTDLKQGALYLALYDEVFINGERDIGGGERVLFFDRNRAYAALGYSLTDRLRAQLGYMQQTTNSWNKGQAQLSLHQTW